MCEEIAHTIAPGNENAEKLADVIDLSSDLALGIGVRQSIEKSVGLVANPSKVGVTLERIGIKDPTDLGQAAKDFQTADYVRTAVKYYNKKEK